jgi:hypothetical protein
MRQPGPADGDAGREAQPRPDRDAHHQQETHGRIRGQSSTNAACVGGHVEARQGRYRQAETAAIRRLARCALAHSTRRPRFARAAAIGRPLNLTSDTREASIDVSPGIFVACSASLLAPGMMIFV